MMQMSGGGDSNNPALNSALALIAVAKDPATFEARVTELTARQEYADKVLAAAAETNRKAEEDAKAAALAKSDAEQKLATVRQMNADLQRREADLAAKLAELSARERSYAAKADTLAKAQTDFDAARAEFEDEQNVARADIATAKAQANKLKTDYEQRLLRLKAAMVV